MLTMRKKCRSTPWLGELPKLPEHPFLMPTLPGRVTGGAGFKRIREKFPDAKWFRTNKIGFGHPVFKSNQIWPREMKYESKYHFLLNNVSIIHEQNNSSIRVSVKINIFRTEDRKTFLQISVDQKQKIYGCSFWKDICKYFLLKYFQR